MMHLDRMSTVSILHDYILALHAAFGDSNLLLGQPVQRIYQPVDLLVRGIDLPLKHRLDLRVMLGRVLPAQLKMD